MKLEQLEHIIEIEKQKSISKAAKALYISQPTLSSSLTSLEEEIGVPLFERTYTGVVPTEEGREAGYLAKQALSSTSQILNLGRKQGSLTGKVTVYIGQAYSYLYNAFLLQFRQRYPQAELNLLVRSQGEIIDEMTAGRADIGLAVVTDGADTLVLQTRLENINLSFETFGQYGFKVYVGHGSRYAEQGAITMQELQQEQLLANFATWKYLVQRHIKPEKDILLVSENEALKQMICNGDGVAILPELFEKQTYFENRKQIIGLKLEGEPVLEAKGCLLSRQQRTLLEEGTMQLLKELIQHDM